MSDRTDSSHTDQDPVGLLAAVERQKQKAAKPRAKPAAPPEEDMPDDLFDDALADLGDEAPGKRARKPAAKRVPLADDSPTLPAGARAAVAGAKPKAKAKPPASPARPGLITRGVRAGLDGVRATRGLGRLGIWGSAALAAGLTVCALAFASSSVTPPPAKLSGVRVDYVSGPKLPASDVLALLRGYPHRDRLVQPSRADLIELTGFLGAQPMVKEVHAIRTIDEPVEGKAPRRMLELSLSLREPRLPVVLATGSRAWLDEDGRVLPGVLPGPTQPRPIVRGIEAGGTAAVREALWLWSRLEGRIEPGLITDIRLDDPLDLKNQRGLVLCTRQGSRVIWGRPGDERYGVEAEDKVSDLVHTIRCQGDLGRIAVINVRFKDPFFVLRPSSAPTPSVVQ